MKIIPYEHNAKIHDETQIKNVAQSIKDFGFVQPIVVDKNGVIIIGHCRLKALELLGYTADNIPNEYIKIVDLNEKDANRLRLLDNKSNESGWDYSELLNQIKDLDFTNYDIDWNLPDIDKEVDEDEPPEIDKTNLPTAKLGDIYKLGEHRLMCGDSTNEEDVKKLMDGALADLVVTDPPYNVDYGSKAEAINKYGYKFSDRHIKNDYMPEEQFVNFLDKAFKNMSESLKNGGSFYIFHASITVFEFEYALRLNELKTRQQLIWVKNAIVLGRQDYQWRHEPCLYGWKDGAAHYFVDDRTNDTVIEDFIDFDKLKKDEAIKMLKEIYADKISTTIIRENKPTRSDEHPTMKPIKLLEHFVKNSSREREFLTCLEAAGLHL